MLLAIGIGALAILNGIGFVMMWLDKAKAQKQKWRIPERNFFLISLLGGSIGCWVGMYVFHHKTQHSKFTVGIPMILLAQIALLLYAAAKWL